VRANFYRSLAENVSALPGVRSVTFSHTPALADRQISGLLIEEGQSRPGPDDPSFYPFYRVVGADYFRTMGMQLLHGRDFTEDDDENTEPVAVVNEALASLMWPSENPIGKRVVALGLDFRSEESNRSLTVVGVATNVRHQSLDGETPDAIYAPWPQHPDRARSLTLIAEVNRPAARLTRPIRDLVQQADPNLPPSPTETFEARVRNSVQDSSFRASLISVIAGLALMLALLGVFGVMNYSVAQRIREMAIRMAIGARRWDLQRLILGDGLRYIVFGQILGTVGIVAVARFVEPLLYDVSGFDSTVFAVVSLCLALVVLLTCYIPSWRASHVDPIGMLKEE
jgi:predicted permease